MLKITTKIDLDDYKKTEIIEIYVECDTIYGDDDDAWIDGDAEEFADFGKENPLLKCLRGDGRCVEYAGTKSAWIKSGLI